MRLPRRLLPTHLRATSRRNRRHRSLPHPTPDMARPLAMRHQLRNPLRPEPGKLATGTMCLWSRGRLLGETRRAWLPLLLPSTRRPQVCRLPRALTAHSERPRRRLLRDLRLRGSCLPSADLLRLARCRRLPGPGLSRTPMRLRRLRVGLVYLSRLRWETWSQGQHPPTVPHRRPRRLATGMRLRQPRPRLPVASLRNTRAWCHLPLPVDLRLRTPMPRHPVVLHPRVSTPHLPTARRPHNRAPLPAAPRQVTDRRPRHPRRRLPQRRQHPPRSHATRQETDPTSLRARSSWSTCSAGTCSG